MKFLYCLSICIVLLMASCARPIAKFNTAEAKTHIAPATISFTNTSEKADAYEWNFGDGTTATDANPTHCYYHSGSYIVTLKAKKGNKMTTTSHKITIDAPLSCLILIETDLGNMTVQLYDATPQHRDNFIKLAEQGYFDSLMFHRVINGFMIQGGDPNSKNAQPGEMLGMGGPNYTIPAEFVDTLVHLKGALAAARTGDSANPQKRSSGSQFYIAQGRPLTDDNLDQVEAQKGFRYPKYLREQYKKVGGIPFLDRDYTVFGRVIDGIDVIDKIAEVETAPGDRPRKDVRMKVRVIK
ncbi:MAG: peptidylprolyl isomerase [Saprospiraceae bacterium]|nr:peptidylprolyl isomerase [Saprospiraceae bacterium]MBP7680197.1 peptidylprolyl isomerase [Saprospiraceae bacterium]